MTCTEFHCQPVAGVLFGQPKAALRVGSVPLGTPPGPRIKAFVMADGSQHLRVKAKLKELIERASSAADANWHRRIKPYPLGFAIRANGSKFAFKPENIEDNDTAVADIRTLVSATQRRLLRINTGCVLQRKTIHTIFRRR
jgi:hypothetical protein